MLDEETRFRRWVEFYFVMEKLDRTFPGAWLKGVVGGTWLVDPPYRWISTEFAVMTLKRLGLWHTDPVRKRAKDLNFKEWGRLLEFWKEK